MYIHDERKSWILKTIQLKQFTYLSEHFYKYCPYNKNLKFDQGMQETIKNSYAHIFKYQPN